MDCVFCKIIKREIPASIVYEDAHTLAFMDAGQVNPGHVLVATKAHVDNIYGLNAEQAAAVFQAAAKIAQTVKKTFNPDGMSLLQANESAGFQTVMHFHIHVLPRLKDDGVTLTWPGKNPPREKLGEWAAKIRAALG